ncbi:hypothetical protein NQ315_006870 [Exocentrus adspersus]|uniref:Uncharacterized protein n=1 Tax=Exocentrus adspersus TaxID=1586481 RepID=A0AAV8WC65_9CUCU|nr:hypothetical protein NQ315_006870 [Exocentrus adspersus]
MRLLLLFLIALATYEAQSTSEKCFTAAKKCHSTNYQEYVDCIRTRQKRSTDCDSPCDSDNCIETCNECDCNSCSYSSCQNSCDSCCSTCCSNYNECKSNHCCHKTCHAQCRSSSCRSSCRKSCYERVKDQDENSPVSSNSTNYNRHNITTIIHLNNVINNTNVIDIPIMLNSTNKNNITIYEQEHSDTSTNPGGNCCIVISPRQCVPQKEYPYVRCFHYRTKQCNEFCTAPIVHKEEQQICQTTFPGSAPSCRQQVIYIPQPQPRCTYQSVWPYVSCGVPKSQSCAGCYSHYVNQNSQDYIRCPSACYDDGFGVGPYYRQGPFYRPTYTHLPCIPCYGFGGYPGLGGYDQGYGAGGYPAQSGYPPIGAGYPPVGGGYPPFVPGAGYGDPAGVMPYGSWAPGIENPFNQTNNTSPLNLEPVISVGPNLAYNPFIPADPFRNTRELEIEVKYEEPQSSDGQAEVKIKKPDLEKSEGNDKSKETKTKLENSGTTEATTSSESKLS